MKDLQRKVQVIAALLILSVATPGIAAERPDAGKTIGSLRENGLALKEKAAPSINFSAEKLPSNDDETQIKVGGIRITGQDIFSEDKLLLLVKDAIGKQLTLSELESVARRIENYFHERGYIFANAVIPAQNVTNGIIEINVVVGRYGKFEIRNQSSLSKSTITSFLSSLKSGDYIHRASLERTLLLLSDSSGVNLRTTIAPGEAPGTSDFILELTDTDKVVGKIYTDNWGNRFTGEVRTGGELSLNNPGFIGDCVTIGGLYAGAGLRNINLNYTVPIKAQGARLAMSYSRVNYLLEEQFADSGASGQAKIASFYISYPFRRARDSNLYGRFGYEMKSLSDKIANANYFSDKTAYAWNASLNADIQDEFGSGTSSFNLNFTSGRLNINSDDAQIGDVKARTAGNYNKTILNIQRQKYLNNRLSYYLSFTGQFASKNLDSSEKISLGGSTGVRAYPPGEALGDEGYLTSGELRWNLPTSRVQLAAFLDSGRVTVNNHPWDMSVNKRILTGAGLGLIFARLSEYTLRMDYAWKISTSCAVADNNKNGRFWLQGVKYF